MITLSPLKTLLHFLLILTLAACQNTPGNIDISQAKVYQSDEGAYMYALDANTGKEIWKFKTKRTTSGPVVSGDQVYFTDYSPMLYSVNIKTGVGTYGKALATRVTTPIQVDGQHLYFISESGYINCRDKTTGESQWVKDLHKPPLSLGIGPKHVYVPNKGQSLMALDKLTGEERWKYSMNRPLLGRPTVVGNLVIMSTDSPTIFAFDTLNAWKKDVEKASPTAPVLHKGSVYWGLASGKLVGLDVKTGKEFWSHQLRRPILSDPLIHDGVIYYGANDKRFYAQSLKTKEILWVFQSKYWIMTTPRYYDGKVYFTDGGGSIYCIELATRKLLWKYRTNGALDYMNPLVVKDGVVYCGGESSSKVVMEDNELVDMREFYAK